MDIDTLQGLKRCPLFTGLAESEIINLMHMVRYRVIRCRKGEVLAFEGSVCQYADIIINGELVTNLMGNSGRIIRVATHQTGKLLAPAFFFGSDNQYPVTIEASTETTILRLMPTDLEKMLNIDPRLMMNYIKMLSNIVSHLTKKVRMLSMSVREKVSLYLKEQSRLQETNNILLPMSRQELADHFGIQKYSLLRCLNELKQEGAILVEGRHIQILSL
jgi:CRP-like cAMP-binding protein